MYAERAGFEESLTQHAFREVLFLGHNPMHMNLRCPVPLTFNVNMVHDIQVLVPFGKKAMANHKELRTSLYGMDAEDTACVSKVSAGDPCGL